MRLLVTFLWILLVAIPVFAFFKLLRSLENNKVDESAKERFYEALCEQYGRPLPKASKTESEVQKPKRSLTEEERIALARRLSDDPFAEITASDIISESCDEEKITEPAAESNDIKEENMTAVQQTETVQTTSDSEKEQAENKKMSRDEALAMVSNILGNSKSSKGKNKNKGKGDAYFELQATLNKYKKD